MQLCLHPLRVITNAFLIYVVNKKRYRISLFIFVCAFVGFLNDEYVVILALLYTEYMSAV